MGNEAQALHSRVCNLLRELQTALRGQELVDKLGARSVSWREDEEGCGEGKILPKALA